MRHAREPERKHGFAAFLPAPGHCPDHWSCIIYIIAVMALAHQQQCTRSWCCYTNKTLKISKNPPLPARPYRVVCASKTDATKTALQTQRAGSTPATLADLTSVQTNCTSSLHLPATHSLHRHAHKHLHARVIVSHLNACSYGSCFVAKPQR